jgi:hypothetical protein
MYRNFQTAFILAIRISWYPRTTKTSLERLHESGEIQSNYTACVNNNKTLGTSQRRLISRYDGPILALAHKATRTNKEVLAVSRRLISKMKGTGPVLVLCAEAGGWARLRQKVSVWARWDGVSPQVSAGNHVSLLKA